MRGFHILAIVNTVLKKNKDILKAVYLTYFWLFFSILITEVFEARESSLLFCFLRIFHSLHSYW